MSQTKLHSKDKESSSSSQEILSSLVSTELVFTSPRNSEPK